MALTGIDQPEEPGIGCRLMFSNKLQIYVVKMKGLTKHLIYYVASERTML